MEKQEIILSVIKSFNEITGNALTADKLLQLIDLTSVKGCKFVNIIGYNSDKSDNTEVADHLINIGVSYENMIDKDAITLDNINLNDIDVNDYNYKYVNTNGLSLEQYKAEVKNALPLALAELKAPTKKVYTNNYIKLNDVLSYNTSTGNFSILGQSVKKTTHVKGDVKLTKKAPKTVAKELIKEATKSRKDTLRRYNLNNILGEVKTNGDTVIL